MKIKDGQEDDFTDNIGGGGKGKHRFNGTQTGSVKKGDVCGGLTKE